MPVVDAVSVAIAKAVVADLAAAVEAGNFAQTFEPQRNYGDWELELKQAGCLQVEVVPVSTEQKIEPAARNRQLEFNVPIDVVIRQKFGQDNQDDDTGRLTLEAVDELVKLTQDLHTHFTQRRLTDLEWASYESPQLLVCPLKRHLKECHQFTSVLRLPFTAFWSPQ